MAAWLSGSVALAALVWSIAWSLYSRKKLAQEAGDRKEADEREERRRGAEVELLRRQADRHSDELELLKREVELREREVIREDSAIMTAELIADSPAPPEWQGRRVHRFRLTNTGRAHASDVDAWLIDQETREVSEMDYRYSRLPGLPPGESGEVAVVVKEDDREQNPLHLKVTWFDPSRVGPNEYVSKVTVASE